MQRTAPTWLLVSTVACVVIMNVVAALVIVQTFYPSAGVRLGMAGLLALAVVALATVLYTVRGWRAYLRRPPDVGDRE